MGLCWESWLLAPSIYLVVEIGLSSTQKDYTNAHNWVFLLKWCILLLGGTSQPQCRKMSSKKKAEILNYNTNAETVAYVFGFII